MYMRGESDKVLIIILIGATTNCSFAIALDQCGPMPFFSILFLVVNMWCVGDFKLDKNNELGIIFEYLKHLRITISKT